MRRVPAVAEALHDLLRRKGTEGILKSVNDESVKPVSPLQTPDPGPKSVALIHPSAHPAFLIDPFQIRRHNADLIAEVDDAGLDRLMQLAANHVDCWNDAFGHGIPNGKDLFFPIVHAQPEEFYHFSVAPRKKFSPFKKFLCDGLPDRPGLEYTPRFPLDQIDIVLKTELSFSCSVGTVIGSDQFPAVHDVYFIGKAFHCHRLTQIPDRNGIVVLIETDRRIVSDIRRCLSARIIAERRNSMQKTDFFRIGLRDCMCTGFDFMGFPIHPAGLEELMIQFVDIADPGHRNHEVPPGIAHEILDKAFLVAACDVAELGPESVVCRKSGIAVRGFGVKSESFFYCDFGIVKDQPAGNPAKVIEHELLGFQKGFQVLREEGLYEDVAAVAKPSAEETELAFCVIKVRCTFAPVDLYGIAGIELQGHISLGRDGMLFTELFYCFTDGGLSAGKTFFGDEPVIDPFGSM